MAVNKDKNGIWYYSVRVTNSFGEVEQIKKQSKTWKLKRDALKAEQEFLTSYQHEPSTITYGKLFELFLNFKINKIKKRSTSTYDEVNRLHVLPYFGKAKISSITKEQIRAWQQELISKGFSNNYLSKIQTNFKHVLIWGLNNDLINKNPFTIEYAKCEIKRTEMSFFTPEEYKRFISVVDNEIDQLLFEILYWCGIRKGELQALTFNDIDLNSKTLKVNKSFDNMNRIVTTPKNLSSYREIHLPDFLLNKLRDYITRSMNFAGFSSELYLFGFDKHTSATTIERKKNLYCKKAGVKQIRIHDFRHSHVSLMISINISDFDIAKRLGHSREMVNNVYGHWFIESQRKLADKLNLIQSNEM